MGLDVKLSGVDNFNNFQIVKVINGTFPALSISNPGAGKFASGESITTIAHNLGYVPAYVAFLNESNVAYFSLPTTSTSAAGAGASFSNNTFQTYVDKTNVYLLTDGWVYGQNLATGGTGFNCKCYLLREIPG